MNSAEINTENYSRKTVGHSTSEIWNSNTESPPPTDKSTEKRWNWRAKLTSINSWQRVLHFPELRHREKMAEMRDIERRRDEILENQI